MNRMCGNCQWQHNGNCRRSVWGFIEQIASIEVSYNVSAQWGYVGKDDPACPEWTGEDTEPDSDGLTAVYMHAHKAGGEAMRKRVEELEKVAENDVFIIKRQTERIEELKAELQAARKQFLARLCALGRELDGPEFDESPFHSMSLPEITTQLRAFEIRFDKKYSICNNEEKRHG